jgi:transcriptional regulator of met regulon
MMSPWLAVGPVGMLKRAERICRVALSIVYKVQSVLRDARRLRDLERLARLTVALLAMLVLVYSARELELEL